MMRVLSVILLWCTVLSAHAATPRWAKTGADSSPMRWYRDDVRYYVDAGPLSSYVSHDAAVALVDAAAAVWTVPSASLTLTRGGMLAEDVNDASVYLGSNGPIWPADVQAANYDAKNIAVIFDVDGSITDMLLGEDASAPINCRSAAVTESVDRIDTSGLLQHALLVLNGRCTGPAPEQQLQLQYQLMRAFGRVLGIGWSQTNDNVFTGSPAPTYSQQQHWPVMHPIDIVCGVYTYQCLVNPFQLREDDIAAIGLVYPITSNPPAGKELTLQNSRAITGLLAFPNGMGMSGVNVVVHGELQFSGFIQDYESVSSVSGYLVRSENGNPVAGAVPAQQLNGGVNRSLAGRYLLNRIPIPVGASWMNFYVAPQSLNPLYVGAYAVGPYRTTAVLPSGSSTMQALYVQSPRGTSMANFPFQTSAVDCSSGKDGSETSPASVDVTGWWSGRFCGYGHTSWMTTKVQKGRMLTIEVTALDEAGNASSNKALPLIGVWSASDSTGTLPTLMATAAPLNGRVVGLTRLPMTISATQQLRIAVTEQRGEGRPDFNYRARVLYAESVAPQRAVAAGGRIAIHGMGFQIGNTVTIGGLLATVESWSATDIVAIAPALPSTLNEPYAADVAVTDLKTGGSTKIAGGLIYGGSSTDVLQKLSAPSGDVAVGTTAAMPFSVRLVDVAGEPIRSAVITFSVVSGGAAFGCGVAPCSVMTDANGVALTSVTPGATGVVQVSASASGGASVSASFSAVMASRVVTAVKATQLIAGGQIYQWQPQVAVSVNGSAAAVPVIWTLANDSVSSQSVSSAKNGLVSITLPTTLAANNEMLLTACAWTNVCTTLRAKGADATTWRLLPASGDVQSVAASAELASVTMRVVNESGEAVAAVGVSVYQRVESWQPACAGNGRCATPAVYGASTEAVVSDSEGLITFTPMQYSATATMTRVTVSAGPVGYASFSLEKHP